MPCDAFSYYFVVRELDRVLSGGRIEKINMPEADEIFLSIRADRKNYTLVISAGNYPRVHITAAAKENPLSPPSLCMNLRKNIGGGIIKSITQLDAERVIFIDILCRDELGVKTDRRLVCEIMGKYSNVVLLEHDRILECMRHIPLDVSVKRQLLPGLRYSEPQQTKLSPLDSEGIAALNFDPDPYAAVFAGVKGLAQSTINEAINNASNNNITAHHPEEHVGEAIHTAIASDPKCHPEECVDAAIHTADTTKTHTNTPLSLVENSPAPVIARSASDAAIHTVDTTKTHTNTPCQKQENSGFAIAKALQNLYDAPLNPCVLLGEKGDFFVRPYHCLEGCGEYKFFESLNLAMDFFYGEKDQKSRLTAKSKNLTSIVKTALRRAEKRLAEFYSRINESGDFENDRILGDLITANIYRITGGLTSLTTANFYSETGEEIQIPIDPQLSPAANAQKHYKKYAKKKRTLAAAAELAQKAEADKRACEELLYNLSTITSATELVDIAEEMAALSMIKPPPRRKNEKPSSPRTTEVDSFKIFVGKNNVQNERLYKSAAKNDIWLHAKQYHGSHVVIESGARPVPDYVIAAAAAFAAYYSGGGTSPKVEVDYTLIKNVNKQPGGGPGKVFYRDFKTILVEPTPLS